MPSNLSLTLISLSVKNWNAMNAKLEGNSQGHQDDRFTTHPQWLGLKA